MDGGFTPNDLNKPENLLKNREETRNRITDQILGSFALVVLILLIYILFGNVNEQTSLFAERFLNSFVGVLLVVVGFYFGSESTKK